jgi:1,4-alpha-glucan branching enzyme
MAWSPELDRHIRAYNYAYTIIVTNTALLSKPPPRRGSFYPLKTARGLVLLPQDFYAHDEITGPSGFRHDSVYRATGGAQEYSPQAQDAPEQVAHEQIALERTKEHARQFLENRATRFAAVTQCMDEPPLSLCVIDADHLGRLWAEGISFLENLFRENQRRNDLQFQLPGEYIGRINADDLQTVTPPYSSAGPAGYAGAWLDASNDWAHRHIHQAIQRMTELAEHFPNATGIKERLLNQAVREVLLAQSSRWPRVVSSPVGEGDTIAVAVAAITNASAVSAAGSAATTNNVTGLYARVRMETQLRNFTTIYEALGSNHVDTRWLTALEQHDNIYPAINYRVFRMKK